MLVLDLRLLLFALLLALLAVLWAARALYRPLRRTSGRDFSTLAIDDASDALEEAPFGLLLLEGDGDYRHANGYARRLLGLASPHGRLPQASWAQLLAADGEAVRGEGMPRGRHRGVTLSAQHDLPAHREDTGRFVRWWVTPLDSRAMVLLIDASAEQRTEDAARTLINDLSHELRTPLATILTHLEVLGLPGISPEIARQSGQLLKAETQRMVRLVNQMLELGRLEMAGELERRPLDVMALAGEAIAQMAPAAAERHIALSYEADAPLPLCFGDADRLRQLFLNLLDNAVKYSRSGDRVTLALTVEERGIRCAVRDTGPGIVAPHLPYLARRFYRAGPREVAGSGLGLALAAEILRRHDSSLEIESNAEGTNTGTCVRFLLPTAES